MIMFLLTLVFNVIFLSANRIPRSSRLLLVVDKPHDVVPILRDIHPYGASEKVSLGQEGKEIVLDTLWMIKTLIFIDFIDFIVIDNKVKRVRV